MKNYVGEGDSVPAIAPAGGVLAGIGYVIGTAFLVAEHVAAATETFIGRRVGMVRLPKATGIVPAAFAAAYWDDTAKNLTTTVGANKLIGVFDRAYLTGDTLAVVILQP